jgi:anti-sigma regulatory factor (Ser/Thr protein kinase)
MKMKTLIEFDIPSEPKNVRVAVRQVLGAAEKIALSQEHLDRLGTAVAEAVMNAMEHGNKYRSDIPVKIQVASSKKVLVVRITDHGGGKVIFEYVTPDLYAKLAGQQSPRGWGLFLIQNMVDDIRITSDGKQRTLELMINLTAKDDRKSV